MRPAFRILADGADITAAISDRLDRMILTDEAGQESDHCEIRLDDRDGTVSLPPTGAELTVAIGYAKTGLTEMGVYVVDEVELDGWPGRMTIRASAADLRQSLKATKTRSWDSTTLGDMVKAIAAEHGYEPVVGADLAAVAIEHEDQTEESDLHLLTRLAKDNGAVAKCMSTRLVFVPRGQAKSATGQALPTVAIPRTDMATYRVTLAERGKYGAVTARYRDTDAAETTTVQAGTGTPVHALRRTYKSEAEALGAAKAKLAAFQRGEATLSTTIQGNPAVMAEGTVSVSGVRTGVDGEWLVTSVEHELSGSAAFVSRIEGETPTQ